MSPNDCTVPKPAAGPWLLGLALVCAVAACAAQEPLAADPALANPDAAVEERVTPASADAKLAEPSDASIHAPPALVYAPPVDAAQPIIGMAADAASMQGSRASDASLDALDASTSASLAPLDTDGSPLPGTIGKWTYTEFPDTRCRDGSSAAVMLRRGSAPKKLVLYLEGGGQCTDEETCSANPFNAPTFVLIMGLFTATGGIFDFDNPENPVRDWSFVYVPYCTGDRHGGANPEGYVPNVGPQQFVGYLNLKKFLKRIVPTFRDATDVLLTGISAGGYGAANTSFLVQRAFPSVKVKTIIDSGPMLPTSVYAECWQERHRTMWKLEDSYLGDCGSACPNKNDHSLDYGVFLARAFADRPSGLISTTADSVERSFLGIGNDHCTGKVDLLFSAPGISAAKYREGVLAYREKVRPFANFGTFLMDSDEHTFIATDNFYTASSGGIRLRDWFAKILTGEAPGHVGP